MTLELSQIPLDNLIGPGVVIDISEKAEDTNGDAYVTLKDIKQWENKYGRVPKGSVAIMKSGWFKKYADDLR